MRDIALEKKFAVLREIVRAQHFAWREAVGRMCPGVSPSAVSAEMWQVTGRETARAYLKRIDPKKPLPPQVAGHIVSSSRCMGEDAVLHGAKDGSEAFVRHNDCPWLRWHESHGLLQEDLDGCDGWFQATVDEINRELGTKLRVETLEAMPEGDRSCLRRLWVERDG